MTDKKTSDSLLTAINKYNKDSINFAVSYKRPERIEGTRLRAYLTQTGQSANSYIKSLIKADLDNKGVPYPDTCETDTSEIQPSCTDLSCV